MVGGGGGGRGEGSERDGEREIERKAGRRDRKGGRDRGREEGRGIYDDDERDRTTWGDINVSASMFSLDDAMFRIGTVLYINGECGINTTKNACRTSTIHK